MACDYRQDAGAYPSRYDPPLCAPGLQPVKRRRNGRWPRQRRRNAGQHVEHSQRHSHAEESALKLDPARLDRRAENRKPHPTAGEPGTGKSQLTIAVVAAVTTGGEWPCGEGQAPLGNVIILSAEDGAADTIIPRLLAAGADLSRVHVVSAVRNADGSRRALSLQHDLDLLEKKIAEMGDVALVVVDPVSSYLGKTDSHKNSEVRGVLEPLSEMAERTRIAILSVTHFSKAGAGNTTKALHRFIGSIAFTGAPRAAFAVIEDAEIRRPQTVTARQEQSCACRRKGSPSAWSNALSKVASLRPEFCGIPSR